MYWERPRPGGSAKGQVVSKRSRRIRRVERNRAVAAAAGKARCHLHAGPHLCSEPNSLGLHYPTDVASGWTAGTLAAYVMMHDAGFKRDFALAPRSCAARTFRPRAAKVAASTYA